MNLHRLLIALRHMLGSGHSPHVRLMTDRERKRNPQAAKRLERAADRQDRMREIWLLFFEAGLDAQNARAEQTRERNHRLIRQRAAQDHVPTEIFTREYSDSRNLNRKRKKDENHLQTRGAGRSPENGGRRGASAERETHSAECADRPGGE